MVRRWQSPLACARPCCGFWTQWICVKVRAIEPLFVLRAPQWSRVVWRAGTYPSSLFSTPCGRACTLRITLTVVCLFAHQWPTNCRKWWVLSAGIVASVFFFFGVYVLACVCMRLCACACPCVCVCACDSVRVCACVTVCGVCVRACVVKSWRPGLRSMCLCVCANVKPCRLESTPGRKRQRTPTRGHTRLNPPPLRATRG